VVRRRLDDVRREEETVFSDWCCHFNEYGLRRLAAKVAGELVTGSKQLQTP